MAGFVISNVELPDSANILLVDMPVRRSKKARSG
jgi:hypothetical protein